MSAASFKACRHPRATQPVSPRGLGVPFHEIAIHPFPDGEMRVTAGPAAPTTIIYASLDRPNDKLIALMFAAEALRRGGAKRLVLVAPYLCYMRQDAAFHEGEAISQKVIGPLLARCVDRVITVDAHLHRTPDIRTVFPGIESDNLSAMPAISDALRTTGLDPATVVAGPDAESRPWVSDLAGRLGLSHTVAQKTRRGDRSVAIAFQNPAGIAGRPALIVDDIVSSGGTMIACAKALTAAGATTIDAVVTHALFPGATLPRHDCIRHPLDPFDPQRAPFHQRHRARRPVRRCLEERTMRTRGDSR